MIGHILALIALLAIPAFLGWVLFRGLSTGIIWWKTGSCSRVKEPFSFWSTAAIYAALLIIVVGFIFRILLPALTRQG